MSDTSAPPTNKASQPLSAPKMAVEPIAKPQAELSSQVQDDDDGEDDEEDEQDDTNHSGNPSLTSKQTKKKKSKAAAKLRKKLGLGSSADQTQQPSSSSSSSEKLLASGSIHDGKISDDVVQQVQQAVQQEHGAQAASQVNKANLAKIMAMMNLERDAMPKGQHLKNKAQKAIVDHKFWKTQPIMKPDDKPVLEEGPIKPNQPPQEVQQQPYPLPNDFEWVTLDIDDDAQLKELYDLLSANYVEDDASSLRFNYSPEFLHWVLKHPGYKKNWHVGVRVVSTRKLVAFISGIPHELRLREQSYQSTEINFLCIHKKLRSKRLAPVLIKEVTRQCHLTGIFQAIYTSGTVLPTPVSCARYYHRTINAEKLVDIGFSAVPYNMSMEDHIKRYTLPSTTSTVGLREMQERDITAVGKLMRRYMRRFDLAPRFTDDEIAHIFTSGRGVDKDENRHKQVTWTYVVENPETHKITDVFSFYSLPSSILDHATHKVLNAAYLFYYATDVAFSEDEPSASSNDDTTQQASSSTLTQSALAKAKSEGLAEWKTSGLTALTPVELADEENVTRWDKESKQLKAKIKARLNQLCADMLIIARNNDFDVVNCLTIMDNPLFLQEQKFGLGDGFLNFYLFNWRSQPVAGGLGSRPGENDLDPVQHLIKSAIKSNDASTKSLVEQLIRRSANSPAQVGSGNGIVMV